MTARSHWDTVYGSKRPSEVSWYQPRPSLSLDLIMAAAPDRDAAIIDVGGGASTLVDALLDEKYRDVTVLDISAEGLERVRDRLGVSETGVSWIAADVTAWHPERTWRVWHDRAVLHFLIEESQRAAYLATLERATVIGSTVVIATFAPDGPERCSGLPVIRYGPDAIEALLGPRFRLTGRRSEIHRTPAGGEQKFSYAVLERIG